MPGAASNRERPLRRSRGVLVAQLLTTAALLLLVVALLGCGGDGGDEGNGSEEAFSPNVVTDEEIEAQEEGSPGRALLEWWQAFQFRDASQVVTLTSQETLDEIGEKNLENLVTNTGQGLQGIEVLGATEQGEETASVRVGLLQFTPAKEDEPPPDEPTSSTPDTFAMQNEDGEWLFAETAYLEPKLESFKQAQAQREEGGGEQNQTQTTTKEQTTGE
jgi:hypothetical protein